MKKIEIKKKKALEEAIKLFSDMTQEQANMYITENYTFSQINKPIMAAYLQLYATDPTNQAWVQGEFKKICYSERPKQINNIVTDADGVPIRKMDSRGRVKPVVKRANSDSGETIRMFNFTKARKAFVEHFNIQLKNTYTVKPKREEPLFDEFAEIFQSQEEIDI